MTMRKTRKWPLILAIVVALIAIFAFTAPASLLKDPVAEANLPVQVAGYQGRLLNGQVSNLFFKGVNYSNLSWQLDPVALLSGQFSANLSLDDPQAKLSLDGTFDSQESWQVSDLDGQLELAKAARVAPALNLIKPQGQIHFNKVSSSLSNAQFSDTDGTIEWRNARFNISGQALVLGLIEAELSDDGDYLYLDFFGQEGIQPQGQIKITPEGNFETELTINPTAIPNRLSWLQSMGKPGPDGRISFMFKGRL